MNGMAMNRVASSLAAAALVVLASGWTAGASPTHAPNVVLQQADGTAVPLAAYKGKVLLVDFWASWCVPCKTSFPALDAIYPGVPAARPRSAGGEPRRGAPDTQTRFSRRIRIGCPCCSIRRAAAPMAFGVKGMPTSFLIDKTGTIRFTHMGYSGNVDVRYRQEIAQLLSEQ